MPIYEYRCPNGHTFEVFQRMTDPPVGVCETCGAGPVEKVLFPVAVHFKGSGFYSTDYGRGSRKTGKDAETSSTSSDGAATGDSASKADTPKSSDSKSSDSKPTDS